MTDIQSLIQEYKITGSKDVFRKIIDSIIKIDTLWAPISQHTKSVYVEINNNLPTAYIFTNQSYCEEFRERLSGAMLLVRTVNNPSSLRLQMFSDFFRLGIQKVVIDYGHVYQEILMSDIIKENDPPQGQPRKPVKNPELMVAANLFVQEMSRRNAAPQLRQKLIEEVKKGEFLVPANNNVKYDETGRIENGTPITFQIIKNNLGQNFIPVYTDVIEFRKFDQKGEFASIIVPFAGIKPLLAQAEGIIINPQGVNIPLNLQVNENKPMPQDSNSAANKPKPQDITGSIDRQLANALKDDGQTGGYDEEYTMSDDKLSQEMLDEAAEFLKSQKSVRSAYARAINRNGRQGCLYVVDFDGDSIALYQGLVMISAKYVGALQVEMKELDTPEGKHGIEGTAPFYKA
ncbi:MAG: enhanced serine sensitivity protein SseB C-terminal domain-containing protein [Lachnospiraceae bacterium]|nr:enhanced serine sensitivity protein SseB C-terminal domain-containing protein [Lachnospiraceae bacterium]